MSQSYFDRNKNLQIHGDVNFISSGRSAQDSHNILQVSQRVQATNTHSRSIERGFKLLCKNTAPSARYGSGHSFTGPQCHPGTRTAVQDYIFKWLDDPDGPIAMWMNGPVGIGKSAIAQTVAHLVSERGQLSSAFFFFRPDEMRNSAKHLVPTLAYEMTQQMPHTRDRVCETIAANPLIFSSPLEHQINTTLLQPLGCPSELSARGRRLIIIDGLDECNDINTQQTIIRSFISSLLAMSTEIIPHRILIVSRPESHIASTFLAADISPHVKSFTLASWDTEDDIEIFLRAKLDGIKQTHPLKHYLPDVWPNYDSFHRLRRHSVGSFAYASIVIRHLTSHRDNPERTLQDLLSLRPARAAAAFADLDALYRHILLSLDPEMRFTLQKVLCLYVYTSESEIEPLAACLSEEKSIVEAALICASSLIQIHNNLGYRRIIIYHSSFEEFLRDKERSRELYLFSPNVSSAIATALSNLWLHPMPTVGHFSYSLWFVRMGYGIRDTNYMDMTVHVLSTLVATNIPVSFLSDLTNDPEEATKPVFHFFRAIQWKSEENLDSTYRPLYNQAWNVVCACLRSHLNLFFKGTSTWKDIINIILQDHPNANVIASNKWPSFVIFRKLACTSAFPFILHIFPEMDHLEIYSCILERYLALPSGVCKKDMARRSPRELTLTALYLDVLNCHDAMTPDFCQRLEQIVLAGQKASGPITSLYMTSEDCIFLFFYGGSCYLDSKYQLAIRDEEVPSSYSGSLYLAKQTDHYIRRAHAELEFAYISDDVEALFSWESWVEVPGADSLSLL